jgi:carbon monoxide dehydrogenase subunit G
MHFTNEMRVGVPVDEAWDVLTTVERIAPCMPGAELTGVDEDSGEYQGTVKVKLGPITAQYKGVASFESLDPEAHRAVLLARGREMRGQGNASARVVAQLAADGNDTVVTVDTELTITGKVAQFGRGVIADVSNQLLQRFAANLEETLAAGEDGAGDAAGSPTIDEAAPATTPAPEVSAGDDEEAAPSPADAPAPAPAPEVEPIDLLKVARGALLKRLVPAALVLVLLLAVLLILVT